jgi:Ser-tRNA(Ala) deacylase AlaX
MTERVFWSEPYRSRLATTVDAVDGNAVRLVSSIFFAESGGQESDRGTIGGHLVEEARLMDHELVYALAGPHQLQPGDPVDVVIDWPRRYALMRLHFAAEIVLEVATQSFGLTEKIGAHIGPERARIDFATDQPVTPLLEDLRAGAQHWVDANAEIITGFDDAKRLRRYWLVEGLARVPCGGTHLRRTGEVGQLVLKRRNVGRGKERIEIAVR